MRAGMHPWAGGGPAKGAQVASVFTGLAACPHQTHEPLPLLVRLIKTMSCPVNELQVEGLRKVNKSYPPHCSATPQQLTSPHCCLFLE